MLMNYRPVLGFLYALLFLSFVGMSLGQPVGSWISTNYGGWVTLEAVAAYGAYLVALIWLINRISKTVGLESSSSSTKMSMTEIEFLRRQARATEASDVRPVEPVPEDEAEPKLKF